MWLAGAASILANQRAGVESDDVSALQQKQKELKVRKIDTSDIYLYIVWEALLHIILHKTLIVFFKFNFNVWFIIVTICTIGGGEWPSDQKWLVEWDYTFSGGVLVWPGWQSESWREG